jgi:hypothetical protein
MCVYERGMSVSGCAQEMVYLAIWLSWLGGGWSVPASTLIDYCRVPLANKTMVAGKIWMSQKETV